MAKVAAAPPAKQSPWMQYAPLGLAVVVMLLAGWKQGMWSERWGASPELALFANQLNEIPAEFGEWKGVDIEANAAAMKIAGSEGEMIRRYRNASGEEVAVSIICARYQDIFAHTPDRCYPAAGFEMTTDPSHEVFDFGDKSAEFFTTTFIKSEPSGSRRERGFWSWSGDGSWIAPKNPKSMFAGQQWALYKLYIFSSGSAASAAGGNDFTRDFVRAFVPVLHTSLRPAFVQAGRIKEVPAEDPAEG